jgi:hypothetical protein
MFPHFRVLAEPEFRPLPARELRDAKVMRTQLPVAGQHVVGLVVPLIDEVLRVRLEVVVTDEEGDDVGSQLRPEFTKQDQLLIGRVAVHS